jgi:predicted benzoate:H+ symporter BenE
LTAQVTANTTVTGSAVTMINGFSAQLAAAIAAAQAAGATPAQLKSLNDLNTAVKASDDDLAAAIAANTPAG